MHVKKVYGRLLFASFTLVLALGCTGSDTTKPGRVLLIGIDGASPRLVEPMMASGELPNLASLAKSGAHGPLKSFHPLLSPRVWTSIATGKSPKKHGIQSWVMPTGPNTKRLYYGSDRKCHALWNIASEAGLTVGVVNWLMTYPPEVVHGVIVSDHTISGEVKGKQYIAQVFSGGAKIEEIAEGDARGAVVYPPKWRDKALDERHNKGGLTDVPNPFLGNKALPGQVFLDSYISFYNRDEQLTSITLEIEHELHPDLEMVLLQGIDRTSHFLWGGVEPADAYSKGRLTPSEREAAGKALKAYYRFTDALIGRLLEGYGKNDLVLVVSDHGFEAFEDAMHTGGHESAAAENGVVFARGPRIAKTSEPKMTVNDVTPLILAWLGKPVARDMDGRVPDFFKGKLAEPIDTYDTKKIIRLEGSSGSDEILMKQLKELGYVE